MEKTYKIAIIGGTGKAGSYVVKHLLNQGFPIKMLVHSPEKFTLTHPLIEPVYGDARDYQSIRNLLEGSQAVISTLGQARSEDLIFSEAAQQITRIMKELGIRRLITLTGLSLTTGQDKKGIRTRLLSRMMKLSFPSIIKDKEKEYAIIRNTDLDWTVVRVPFIELTDVSKPLQVSLIDCPGKKIAACDLAGFIVDQLTDEAYLRKAPFLSN